MNVEDPGSIGTELGKEFSRRFEILGVLGKGGMGIVLRCRQRDLGRDVAVKLMLEHAPETRARFQREGLLLARLRHPNLITVLATGEARGNPYLVFELIDGRTLRETLDRFGRMEIERAVQVVRQVADALSVTHEQGILHRDVKATNILLTPDGTTKLGDFGLALALEGGDRLTRSGVFMGTPEYTAPEIIRGEPPQAASDLYSLGMVLYETLVGQTSFGNLPLKDLMKAHLDREAPLLRTLRPDVPTWIEYIVRKLLAKDPRQRFKSASEVSLALAEGLEGRGEAAAAVARHPTISMRAPDPLVQTHLSGDEVPRLGQRTLATLRPTGLGESSTVRRARPYLAVAGAGLALLALGAAISALRTEPSRVLTLDVRPGQTTAVVAWKTSLAVKSWLELAKGEEGGAFEPVPGPAREPALDQSQALSGLLAGTAYRVRVACADGSVSLDRPLRTAPLERPRFRVTGPRSAFLDLRTHEPLVAALRIGDRRIPSARSTPAVEHTFALEASDVLVGIERPVLAIESEAGREVEMPLPPVGSLPRELVTRIDMQALGRLFTELYGRSVRTKQDRERVFAQVKLLPFYPYWAHFRPLAEAFFKGPPEIPDSERLDVYNRLVDLEVVDAAALDYRIPPAVAFAASTQSFVGRFVGKPPLKPRYRWKADFDMKRDGFWVPSGNDQELDRIRRNMYQFATKLRDRHSVRVPIAPAELADCRRVALVFRISALVLRSYFEVTLNGRLKLAFRPTESWNYDPLSGETDIGNTLPIRFMRPGDNTLDIEMKTSPGVTPIASAQIWGIEILGE
ncbi:MAG: serine/threonine protein kinase [Candidatus Wallbacteria bacterium]|nr:serine/threonine protein kinase [Candidatus Wallbacteria bacterium]